MSGAGDMAAVQDAAAPAPAPASAELWFRRVMASIIDSVVVAGPFWILVFYALVTATEGYDSHGDVQHPPTVAGAIAMVVGAVYLVAAWIVNRVVWQGRTGQSLGKRIVMIRLVSERSGEPVGAGLALGREMMHVLDVPLCLGYLWPLWDSRGQTFADKGCATRVVDVRRYWRDELPGPERARRGGRRVVARVHVSDRRLTWNMGLVAGCCGLFCATFVVMAYGFGAEASSWNPMDDPAARCAGIGVVCAALAGVLVGVDVWGARSAGKTQALVRVKRVLSVMTWVCAVAPFVIVVVVLLPYRVSGADVTLARGYGFSATMLSINILMMVVVGRSILKALLLNAAASDAAASAAQAPTGHPSRASGGASD